AQPLAGPTARGEGQSFSSRVTELLAEAQRGDVQKVESILVEELERELYGQALRLAWGNQSQAARWLGVSRPTFREKMIVFGLQHGAAGWRSPEPNAKQPKILIIDDEPSFADLLRRFLADEGYLVETAETAEQGLLRAQEGDFDLV